MSLDVFPKFPPHNLPNCLRRDTELAPERGIVAAFGNRSNIEYVGLLERSLRVCLATDKRRLATSALVSHIGEIFGAGAREQVGRVYAWRVVALVAGAFVRAGKLPNVKLEADSVSKSSFFADIQHPVPARVSPAEPRPAFIGSTLVDFGPKVCDLFFVHGNQPSCEPSPGRVAATRGSIDRSLS